MMPFRIRLDSRWPPSTDFSVAQDARYVGQPDRVCLFTHVHAALAHPSVEHSWPDCSSGKSGTDLHQACAYWEAAVYALAVVLGWEDMGLGLQRVYAAAPGKVASPHLDLLQAVWNDQGQLDLLALWAWHRGMRIKMSDATGTVNVIEQERPPHDFHGRDWLREVVARHEKQSSFRADPYHGGTNPLHLWNFLGAFGGAEGEATLLHSGVDDRKAVLVLDHMQGWMGQLHRAAHALPNIGERSWRVDVVVRPVGWLGTYRRSRVTGRWFAGTHSVHMLGFDSPDL